MVADIEDLEEMDASELYARRLNAKEVLTPMKGEEFMFPVADRTFKKTYQPNLTNAETKVECVVTKTFWEKNSSAEELSSRC